jgi:hypothetical protein
VRYGVDLLPYDLAWQGAGLAVLFAGAALLVNSGRGTRSEASAPHEPRSER